MSAFSNATFSAAGYLASRPSYPAWIYKRILDSHRGHFSKALDIGCGPGISTLPLLPHFEHVTGTDTSSGMIATASSLDVSQNKALLHLELAQPSRRASSRYNVEFVQGSAESIPTIKDNSVDLVVSGQAAHWFQYDKFWKELSRIARPGATVALWGYAEMFLPHYPGARQLIPAYSGGKADLQLGPFWEQPGRGIVERGLAEVPFPWDPEVGLEDCLVSQWDRRHSVRGMASTDGLLPDQMISDWPPPLEIGTGNDSTESMDKTMNWDQILGYLHTFSALNRYGRETGKSVDEPPKHLIEALQKEVVRQDGKLSDEILVRWPLSLLICHKLL